MVISVRSLCELTHVGRLWDTPKIVEPGIHTYTCEKVSFLDCRADTVKCIQERRARRVLLLEQEMPQMCDCRGFNQPGNWLNYTELPRYFLAMFQFCNKRKMVENAMADLE